MTCHLTDNDSCQLAFLNLDSISEYRQGRVQINIREAMFVTAMSSENTTWFPVGYLREVPQLEQNRNTTPYCLDSIFMCFTKQVSPHELGVVANSFIRTPHKSVSEEQLEALISDHNPFNFELKYPANIFIVTQNQPRPHRIFFLQLQATVVILTIHLLVNQELN